MEMKPDFYSLLQFGWNFLVNKVRDFNSQLEETSVCQTNKGQVRGVKRLTIYGKSYYAFEGIPFAKPPIGDRRFRAPEPADPWEGILDCFQCRKKPMQKHLLLHFVEGSEDCLYLNIYAKKLQTDKPLPVIVYIHGGGFQIGEASRELFGPDFFMERDVILVSITYRLGFFGFLSFKDPSLDIPGNSGTKDQLLALQWIKENIHNFNGDKENITVLGQSAGAASAHLLMSSEKARGLFHKAILMSGSAFCPWANYPQNNWAYRLAKILGYQGLNIDKEVYEFLLKIDARTGTNIYRNLLSKDERREYILTSFSQSIEAYETSHGVYTKPILESLKTCWGNEIPLMLGGTSDEGLLLYGNTKTFPYLIDELGDFSIFLQGKFQDVKTLDEIKQIGLKIKECYYNKEEPKFEKHLMNHLRFIGETAFTHCIYRTVLARRDYARNQPTYFYRFDYDSSENMYRRLWCGRKIRGTIHSSDLQYLFHTAFARKIPKDSMDYTMMQRMIGMWTAFAETSNPNCAEMKEAKWEAVGERKEGEKEILKVMNIGEKLEMKICPEQERMDLMSSFYKEETLY